MGVSEWVRTLTESRVKAAANINSQPSADRSGWSGNRTAHTSWGESLQETPSQESSWHGRGHMLPHSHAWLGVSGTWVGKDCDPKCPMALENNLAVSAVWQSVNGAQVTVCIGCFHRSQTVDLIQGVWKHSYVGRVGHRKVRRPEGEDHACSM